MRETVRDWFFRVRNRRNTRAAMAIRSRQWLLLAICLSVIPLFACRVLSSQDSGDDNDGEPIPARLAVQTEIPLVKQHLADALWAARGQGTRAERVNRLTGQRRSLAVQPSRADTILGGFAMVARFFPGVRDELAAIDEEIVRGALGPPRTGQTQCFEDQYASTGGQLYELMVGHDRFVADLRGLMNPVHAPRDAVPGHCCHPYDLCTELIAREAGVLVTGPGGGAVDAPLDLVSDVAWAGYANEQVRARIEPLLRAALESRGLLDRRG